MSFLVRIAVAWLLLALIALGQPIDPGSPYASQIAAPAPIPAVQIPVDSAMPTTPDSILSEIAVDLSAISRFSIPEVHSGDTVSYTIAIEWQDTRVPVVVLAPDSVQFQGLTLIEQSTRHRKSADGTVVRNHTEFGYRLLAGPQGMGKAEALKVRYITGLSGREEKVFAPAAKITILAARKSLVTSLWFQILLVVMALAALTWGFLRLKKARQLRASRVIPNPEGAIADDLKALKSRLTHGDSGAILREMERIAFAYFRHEYHINADTPLRVDTLLDRWLKEHPDDLERNADWERLRELFRHARYAGGHKEPHELLDGWRALKRCLGVEMEG